MLTSGTGQVSRTGKSPLVIPFPSVRCFNTNYICNYEHANICVCLNVNISNNMWTSHKDPNHNTQMIYIPNCYMIINKNAYCGTIQSSTDPDLTLARTLTLSIHDYDFDHFSCSRRYATNSYMFVIFIHHTSQLAIKKPKPDKSCSLQISTQIQTITSWK